MNSGVAASSLDVADRDPREAMLGRLVGFGRYARASGLSVGTGRILSFCRAAAALDAVDREDLRLAARSTLVSRPEDFAALDAAFDRYFDMSGRGRSLARTTEGATTTPPRGRAEQAADTPRSIVTASTWSPGPVDDATDEGAAIRVRASEAEALRRKDFGDLTEDERRAAFALIRRMAPSLPERPSRRYRPGPRGSRFDLRGTLRRSLRTEGEPFRRAWKQRQTKRRSLVLLVDVSGSMAPYGRPLVEFAHAASLAGRRVEVFAFGTRLTRITGALRSRDPGEALAAVGQAVVDWEGGTRIGDSVKHLVDMWSSRSALRGSLVVLCSDGLERGDPEVLAAQMARLARLSHRIVWVNPLKGSPLYEPLARGMAASLPFVDVFLPGHNLESLDALGRAVSGH